MGRTSDGQAAADAPAGFAPSVDLVAQARELLPRSWAGEDVTDEVEELLELAAARHDPEGECAARYVLVADASIRGDSEGTWRTARILVERAQLAGLALWESRGRHYLARMHLADGEEAAGIEELVTAEALTDEDTEPSVMLTGAINGIAATYMLLGLFEDSERLYERMNGMLDHIEDPWAHRALLYNRLLNDASWSLALERIGDPDEARDRMRRALALVRKSLSWIDGSSIEADIGLLILFAELLSERIGIDEARVRLEELSSDPKRESESFAHFGLALRLTDALRFEEAHAAVQDGLDGLHPLEGEHVHTALRWLSARLATLEEPEHRGLQRTWDYARLMHEKTWELRSRRRDAVRDRLHLRRLRQEHERVERASLEDALTGVANRRRLDRERRHLDDAEDAGWAAVLYLDLDGFKDVNDRFGHELGDEVLQQLADLLRLSVRANDLVGRYGGDEFVIIAHHCTVEDATALGERVVREVRRHPWQELHPELELTISAGVAVTDQAYDRLFAEADDALYAAKESGRDRSVTRTVDRDREPSSTH